MGYPFWVTTNNLGTFNAGYSLTLTPIVLVFGETDNLPCDVSLLNGELPPGIQFSQSGYQITLRGELLGVGMMVTYQFTFTFRISNLTYVTDRTFQITVQQDVVVFEWITSNDTPLLYVYDDLPVITQIQTECVPIQAVTYSCTNLSVLTQGISLDASSGEITVNLGWQPNTTYTQSKDYVYSNDRLYVCFVSGTSSSSQGPQQPGSNIVDTLYVGWQPNIVYNQGTVVHHDVGKIYVCIQTGTSGSLGPTATGSYILDGSVVWAYQDQALVWNQVPADTQVTITLACEAQASTQINRTFDIQLVSREAAPIWLTDAGLLLILSPGQLFSYQLQVQDPDEAVLTWSSVNLPSWITLSVTGELFGQAPQVTTTTAYEFQIDVTDQIHTQQRTFLIQVTQPQLELRWLTDSLLEPIRDGVLSDLHVQAVSPRAGATITYGWVGGQLPLGLRLNNQTGHLQGFVEFHAQNKVYHFEIQAQDGVDTIHKQFQVQVTCLNRNTYWNVHVPMWGDVRTQLVTLNTPSVVPDQTLYLLNEPAWGRVALPQIQLIGGVKSCGADQMRRMITNYMHAWHVLLQALQITQLSDLPYHTVDVQVQDAVAPPLWQPNTSYAQNARVSAGNGSQYVAQNSGTSHSNAPVWNQPQVSDNNIVWLRLNSPNMLSATSTPLPWYSVHKYDVGMTMVRQGTTYVCVQAGESGATWPHTLPTQTHVLDNQIIWQKVTTAGSASNTYWPACVQNMRQAIQSELGWSQTLGSQAQVQAQVSQGAIRAVNVVAPGDSYWIAPPARMISATGTGAQFQVKVGILNAQVIASTTGVIPQTQFDLNLGTGEPAQLIIQAVNSFNQATQVQVVYSGSYTKIPSVPIRVPVGSAQITLRLQVGVVQVQVLDPGTGYTPTDSLSLLGTEWDAVRQQFIDQFDLLMCLAFIKPDANLNLTSVLNPYVGQPIQLDRVQADVQGVQWQGMTRWDSDTCTWDAHMTQFVEQTTATETTWDQTELTWDNQITTFDVQPLLMHPDISQTKFDLNQTVFDYYATVFDAQPVTYESRTKRSWVWFMSTHE